MKNNVKQIFVGENKYTTGLLFMFATIMGFFSHMRRIEFDDTYTFMVIFIVALLSSQLSKL
jgi:hypothetical protein